MSCLAGAHIPCCLHLNAPEQLLHCVNNAVLSVQQAATENQNIMFATFISENIYSYAGSSLLFNARYLESKNYPMRILSAETGDDYYPQDRRWNKIKAVSNALLKWAKTVSYLVFIDADLLILDPEFDAESVIAAHPTANLIVAADVLDTANTGFMIVRNCPWSIDFFDRWWASRDLAGTFCDQHVLNKLLKNTTDRNYVGITHPKAINSQWPVIDNFNEQDPILHLMGETNEIRVAVSRYVAESVCNATSGITALTAISGASGPAYRVPLTREILHNIRIQSVQAAWNASVAQCRSVDAHEEDFNMLQRLISHECDRVKRISLAEHTNADNMCRQMLHDALEIHLSQVDLATNQTVTQKPFENDASKERFVLHLTRLLMLRFTILEMAVARSAHGKNEKRKTEHDILSAAQQVLSQIEVLQDALNMQTGYNIAFTRHKRGMVFALLSEFYQRTEQWDAALEHEKMCITELAGALEHTTSEQLEFAGFVLAYVRSAARLAETFRRKERLQEAEEWANIALNNANLLYASGNNEERKRITELTRIHTLCQRVYFDLQIPQKASAHAQAIEALVEVA